jgi:hypothetical protein
LKDDEFTKKPRPDGRGFFVSEPEVPVNSRRPLAPGTLFLLSAVLVVSGACEGRADRLAAGSREHLQQAVSLLEQAAGDTDKAVASLDAYLAQHREEMIKLRSDGAELVRAMAPEAREKFGRESLEKVRPLRERLDTLVRTFPEPARIVKKLQEFL